MAGEQDRGLDRGDGRIFRTGPGRLRLPSDPRFDALIDAAGLETDPERRTSLLAEAERIALADCPAIPVAAPRTVTLVSPRVKGWIDNARDVHPGRFLSVSAD